SRGAVVRGKHVRRGREPGLMGSARARASRVAGGRMTPVVTTNREELAASYRRMRERSRLLFDLLAEEAYYSQPIDLRHPIVFYEGHLPGFSFNTLVNKGLGGPGIDAKREGLFARGIDPDEKAGEAGGAGGAGG